MLLLPLIGSIALGQVQLQYPEAHKSDHVDQYHGHSVADPYRWLEQPIETPEVKAWVDAENALTMGYLDKIPGRDRLLKELQRRVNYERFSTPTHAENTLVYERNSGLQNQEVVYVVKPKHKNASVLIDPNTLSKDGTVGIGASDLSDDGRHYLYALTEGGSDWMTWKVRDVTTGKDYADSVKWSKFGGGFLDASGMKVYYLRYPEGSLTQKNEGSSIYLHTLGTDQKHDELVFNMPNHPDWFLWASPSPNRDWIFFNIQKAGSPNNLLYMQKAGDTKSKMHMMFAADDGQYSPVSVVGDLVYVQTTRNAPMGKLISFNLKNGSVKNVIGETQSALQSVTHVGGHFIATYLKDAHSVATLYNLKGRKVKEIRMPGLGTAAGFAGKPSDRYTYYSYADFFTPTTIFKLDVWSGKSTIWKKPTTAVDPNKYVAQQVFYKSKDGTRVPMYVVHKKGLKRDGKNPTLLYGYGGFNASQVPWFSTSRSVWMDMGGVWCLANIRGGGEYGESWWLSATKTHRQRAYDDFIASGEWLIKNNYASPATLAIQGGSNGGLLVGACMTQRPELFGVCIPEVGVMDLLRFNKFTIGAAWESDYGSPENPKEFASLIKISPYHNLKPGTKYPATLVTTADRDDRVVPAHSFKFAARLQECQGGPDPVLIRIETTSGHGSSNLAKALESVRDVYSFTLFNMDRKIPAKF